MLTTQTENVETKSEEIKFHRKRSSSFQNNSHFHGLNEKKESNQCKLCFTNGELTDLLPDYLLEHAGSSQRNMFISHDFSITGLRKPRPY